MAIQMRRGADNKFDPAKMLPAEMAVTVDGTRKVYAAFGPGDVKELASKEEVQNIVNNFTGTVDKKIAEAVKQVTDEAQEQIDNIENKAQEVLDSIPADYQTTVAQVEKNTLAIFDLDRFKASAIIQKAKGRSIVIKDSAKAGISGMRTLGKSEQRKLTGKNLLENTATSTTRDGITFTVYEDGSVTLDGVATKDIYFCLNSSYSLPDGDYILSTGHVRKGLCYLYIKNDVGDYFSSYESSTHISASIDNYAYIFVASGYEASAKSVVFKPMIRLASITDSTYEPYCGGSPVPNPQYPQAIVNAGQKMVDGWQLLDTQFEDITIYGVSLYRNADGSIKIKGTSTAQHFLTLGTVKLLTNKTYFLSGAQPNANIKIDKAGLYDVGNGITYKPTEDVEDKIVLRITSGITYDTTIYPMLNEGTEAKPWEPYTCGGFTDGSQLANLPDVEEFEINGVKWSCKNGIVTAKGAATGISPTAGKISYTVPIVAGTYTVSEDIGGVVVYVSIKSSDGTMTYPHNRSFTLDGTEQEVVLFCQVSSGTTVDTTVLPMLNRGSVAKAWQPYTAGMKPVIDVPIETEVLSGNLFDFDNAEFTRNDNAVLDSKANGEIVFTRIATKTSGFYAKGAISENFIGHAITVSFKAKTDTSGMNVRYYVSGVGNYHEEAVTTAYKQFSFTFIPTATGSLIFYGNAVAGKMYIKDIQIERGTEATPYQPYTKQTLSFTTPNGLPGIPVTDASLANYTDENGQMWCCDERDWEQEIYVGNLLENVLQSQTKGGMTFTVNSDGSVTVNGTATENMRLWVNAGDFSQKGTFVLSGCPMGATGTDYKLDIVNEGVNTYASDIGNSIEFTLTDDVPKAVRIYINSGTTLNNAVFKPMIRPVEIDGIPTSAKYVPYTDGKMVKRRGADVRRIGERTSSGTDVIDSSGKRFRISIRPDALTSSDKVLCTDYMCYNLETCRVADYGITMYGGSVYVRNKDWGDLDAANASLVKKPVTFQYILATPILTHITEEEASAQMALHTNYQSTTILSDADVEVDYVTDTKTYIDNKFAELAAAYVAGSEV